jgi:hypothetical protein
MWIEIILVVTILAVILILAIRPAPPAETPPIDQPAAETLFEIVSLGATGRAFLLNIMTDKKWYAAADSSLNVLVMGDDGGIVATTSFTAINAKRFADHIRERWPNQNGIRRLVIFSQGMAPDPGESATALGLLGIRRASTGAPYVATVTADGVTEGTALSATRAELPFKLVR